MSNSELLPRLDAAIAAKKRPAQPVQVRIQRRRRPRRPPVPPHRVSQRTDIDPAARVDQQPGQQPAQDQAARRPRRVPFFHIDRAKVTKARPVPPRH